MFNALTSHEETLLGDPIDSKAFHTSLSLPIDSVNLFQKTLFLLKIIFCSSYLAALYISLLTYDFDFFKLFE